MITSIEGIDVTGANFGQSSTLLRAPPETTLVLGLARNATIRITLAAP